MVSGYRRCREKKSGASRAEFVKSLASSLEVSTAQANVGGALSTIRSLGQNAQNKALDARFAILQSSVERTNAINSALRQTFTSAITFAVQFAFMSVFNAGNKNGLTDKKKLAELMVGRTVNLRTSRKTMEQGEVLLEVNDLSILSDNKEYVLSNVDLKLHKNEILGIAGVQGNGQTELIEALTGLRSVSSGKISYFGKEYKNFSPRKIHQLGVRHIPEDRQKQGLIGEFSLTENSILNTYYEEEFSYNITLNWTNAKIEAKKIIEKFDVRTNSENINANKLSGGNQQKLLIGREMSRSINLLIASQPTRGVDVGSIEYIHNQIVFARNKGIGVILNSTELEEIIALSDRIIVFFEGKVIAEFPSDTDPNIIGLAMAGEN